MVNDEDEFFAAGLIHYGTAVRAIEDFKEVLYARLIRWTEEHAWSTFAPDDDWRTELSRYAKESEFYVSIGVPGKFAQEKCKLEIGVLWPAGDSGKLSVYMGLHGDMPWRKKVHPTSKLTQRDGGSTAYLVRNVAPATWKAVADELALEFEGSANKARST